MSVAKTYAQALYQAAIEAKISPDTFGEFESQMDQILKAVSSSKETELLLFSPIISGKKRSEMVLDLAKKTGMTPILGQFLALLSRKGRLSLLKEVRAAFTSVRLNAEGSLLGQLVSAEAISDEDVQSLAKAFGKKLGKKVAFQVSTDASLLAGMKVTVSGVTYDGTLRSQLHQLRDGLTHGAVN